MERVTWPSYKDIKRLKTAVESRGHMVRDTDLDVLDRSIVTGRSRPSAKPDAGPTFWAMYEQFMAEHPFHKPSTVRAYKFHIQQLSGWHDRPVKEITESDATEPHALGPSSAGRATRSIASSEPPSSPASHRAAATPTYPRSWKPSVSRWDARSTGTTVTATWTTRPGNRRESTH
jgi:hypothetical protein